MSLCLQGHVKVENVVASENFQRNVRAFEGAQRAPSRNGTLCANRKRVGKCYSGDRFQPPC